MGNLGGGEILVIMLVALLVLGPSKLPDAARQLGRAVAEFRKVSGGFQRELRAALDGGPEATTPTSLSAPVPAADSAQRQTNSEATSPPDGSGIGVVKR